MPTKTNTATKNPSTAKAAKPNPAPVKAATKPTTTTTTTTAKPEIKGSIKLLKSNPHRVGTKDYQRFASLNDGVAVAEALNNKADVRRVDLTYWTKRGVIEIVQ